MSRDDRKRSSRTTRQTPDRQASNAGPILIILAVFVAGGLLIGWLSWSHPVNRYNTHLQKAMRIQAAAHKAGEVDQAQNAAAREEFLTALALGERAFGPDDVQLEGVLTVLQKYAVRDKDWQQAKTYAERLLKIQQQQYGPVDERLVETYNALGQAYRELGDFAAEERSLKQIAKIMPDVLGTRELAAFYGRHKRYSEALPLYRQLVSVMMIEVAKRKVAKPDEQYGQALMLTSITTKEYMKILQATGNTKEYRAAVDLEKKIQRELLELQKISQKKAPVVTKTK